MRGMWRGLLDIPFYALNFQHDFGGIIDYFVREYNRGGRRIRACGAMSI